MKIFETRIFILPPVVPQKGIVSDNKQSNSRGVAIFHESPVQIVSLLICLTKIQNEDKQQEVVFQKSSLSTLELVFYDDSDNKSDYDQVDTSILNVYLNKCLEMCQISSRLDLSKKITLHQLQTIGERISSLIDNTKPVWSNNVHIGCKSLQQRNQMCFKFEEFKVLEQSLSHEQKFIQTLNNQTSQTQQAGEMIQTAQPKELKKRICYFILYCIFFPFFIPYFIYKNCCANT